ncbi:YARHG domain-containing protein [Butyrivibrio sp. AE2032]|uniref:YARHG domain-containing protein n=1 Tax=Butyrivibrio sp. AE2032 TaxID=1458463 RepID=UPI00054DAB37|nr:YARHG domain-containing protein [Butyrivibrio sp. AE2032]
MKEIKCLRIIHKLIFVLLLVLFFVDAKGICAYANDIDAAIPMTIDQRVTSNFGASSSHDNFSYYEWYTFTTPDTWCEFVFHGVFNGADARSIKIVKKNSLGDYEKIASASPPNRSHNACTCTAVIEPNTQCWVELRGLVYSVDFYMDVKQTEPPEPEKTDGSKWDKAIPIMINEEVSGRIGENVNTKNDSELKYYKFTTQNEKKRYYFYFVFSEDGPSVSINTYEKPGTVVDMILIRASYENDYRATAYHPYDLEPNQDYSIVIHADKPNSYKFFISTEKLETPITLDDKLDKNSSNLTNSFGNRSIKEVDKDEVHASESKDEEMVRGIDQEAMKGSSDKNQDKYEKIDALIITAITREITEDELKGYTSFELSAVRNGIYAVHGYVFKSEQWNDYFKNFTWYVPDTSFKQEQLNSLENSNAGIIRTYEEKEFGGIYSFD